MLTYTLMGVNIAVWAVSAFFGGSDPQNLIRFGAKYDVLIWSGQYWRLITPIFLHAGLIHLLFNSYALYGLGVGVEILFGRVRYLVIYLVSGVMSTVVSLIFSPSLSVGASGAIFGLFGAYVYFAISNRRRVGRSIWAAILPALLFNLAFGLVNPGIDNYAHVGGLLGGIGVSYVVGSRAKAPRRTGTFRWLVTTVIVAVFLGAVTVSLHPPRSKWFYDFNAGNRAAEAGDYSGAEDLYKSSIAAKPDNAAAHYNLAIIYIRTSRRDLAKAELQQALTVNPQYQPARDLLNQLGGT
ncbi:MAG TPA: rhomboid family intramembrane serine protease [Bacillota bacterium]|jgi:rhomboid protease GluP